MKTRKLSIGMKILLPTIVMILADIIFICITLYNRDQQNMIDMAADQALVAATTSVQDVYGNSIRTLKPGDETSITYEMAAEALREDLEFTGAKYLYTLYTDGNKVYYGVDADDSENKCMIGEEFGYTYSELKSVFDGEPYVQKFIDTSEGEALISAYVPIYDNEGKVV